MTVRLTEPTEKTADLAEKTERNNQMLGEQFEGMFICVNPTNEQWKVGFDPLVNDESENKTGRLNYFIYVPTKKVVAIRELLAKIDEVLYS